METYKITHPATNKVVNLYIGSQTGPVPNGARLSLYSWQNNNDQKWQLEYVDGSKLLRLARDTSKVMNRNSKNNNAHVWYYDGTAATKDDSLIQTETIGGHTRIKLVNRGLYLTKNMNDSFLSWAGKIDSSRQYFEMEAVSGGGGGTANTTLKNYPFLSQYSFTVSAGYEATFADSACLATCYLTIANYFGKNTTMQHLINIGDVDRYSGGVLRFTLIGVDSYIYSTAVPSGVIKSEIAANRPVILRLTPANDLNNTHFVVAYGYTGGGNLGDQILVMDPARRVESGQMFHGTLADAVKYQHRLGRVLTGYRKVYRK